MTVGYLIKENSKDAEKIYYDFDDIENGNKLYREQVHPPRPPHRLFWTGSTNNLKWFEVEPPKPISFWDTGLGKLLKFGVIGSFVSIIHFFIYIATLLLIGVVISWRDPEFSQGGGIVLVLFSFPFYITSVPYFVHLVFSYI